MPFHDPTTTKTNMSASFEFELSAWKSTGKQLQTSLPVSSTRADINESIQALYMKTGGYIDKSKITSYTAFDRFMANFSILDDSLPSEILVKSKMKDPTVIQVRDVAVDPDKFRSDSEKRFVDQISKMGAADHQTAAVIAQQYSPLSPAYYSFPSLYQGCMRNSLILLLLTIWLSEGIAVLLTKTAGMQEYSKHNPWLFWMLFVFVFVVYVIYHYNCNFMDFSIVVQLSYLMLVVLLVSTFLSLLVVTTEVFRVFHILEIVSIVFVLFIMSTFQTRFLFNFFVAGIIATVIILVVSVQFIWLPYHSRYKTTTDWLHMSDDAWSVILTIGTAGFFCFYVLVKLRSYSKTVRPYGFVFIVYRIYMDFVVLFILSVKLAARWRCRTTRNTGSLVQSNHAASNAMAVGTGDGLNGIRHAAAEPVISMAGGGSSSMIMEYLVHFIKH